MTRPTDASTARAFREVSEGKTFMVGAPISSFVESVLRRAAEFDAESPAGTECKICGGGNVYCAACMSKSAPEVTVNSERVQIPAESTHVRCPKCPAHMPAGLYCGGAQCPLRKS